MSDPLIDPHELYHLIRATAVVHQEVQLDLCVTPAPPHAVLLCALWPLLFTLWRAVAGRSGLAVILGYVSAVASKSAGRQRG